MTADLAPAHGRSRGVTVAGAPGRLAVVAVLTVTAAAAFAPLFAGTRHLGVVFAAAAAPFVVTALCLLVPGLPAALRAPLGLTAAGLVAMFGARAGTDVVHGPLRLLTGALPFDPTGPELAAVALAVGTAATAGAELAVVARRPPTAAVPAALCLVVALAVGASGRPPPAAVPAALVGGLGALLAVAAVAGTADRRPPGPRLAGAGRARPAGTVARLAVAGVIVAAASVLASTVGRDAPGATARGARFDARALVAEQVLPKSALSPLAAFADLRAARAELLFTVRADRAVDRLRVATLTRFDGHLWSATGPHLRAGGTLPVGPAGGGDTPDATLAVEVVDPDRATWLPTLGASGRAVEISVPGLGVDPATGDLVVPTDRQVPRSYRVITREPVLSVDALRDGVAATRATASRDALTRAPALERTYLPAIREVIDQEPMSFGRLAALSTYFSRNGGFSRDDDEAAPSGHGLSQIERLLRTRRGTAEQYASAFAVLAGHLGYDARVAVGFRPASPAPAGEPVEITGASVHAWPEVRFRRLGWVPFEPTPTVVRPRRRPDAATPSTSDRVAEAIDREASGQRRDARRGDPARPTATRPATRTAPGRVLPAVLGAFTAALAVAVVLPPLAKGVRRRRRRRAAEPWRRVTGAWDDTVDRLVEHRVPVDHGMTSGELTAAAVERLGRHRTPGLAELAVLADSASFAADGVGTGGDVVAWELCDQLRRALAAGVPPHRRLGRAVDPRPLRRRRTARGGAAVASPVPASAGSGQAR